MIFTHDLGSPEGPVVLKDKSWLVVEMSPNKGCITHISPDGKEKKIIAKTGRPNGLAVDREGTVWVAESLEPSLVRLTMDGTADVFLTGCDNEAFMWPNDLAFGPDGYLYMTDSGINADEFVVNERVREDYMDLEYDGRVYKINTKTGDITKLDEGIRFTNGIAFDAENNLYVNETMTGMVYRYRYMDGQIDSNRESFGNANDDKENSGIRGPDGMKFGANGNLYVAVYGQGDVTVLGKDGSVAERIKTGGSLPTNLAFGSKGEKKIYVTEVESSVLEIIEVDTEGLPLYD